MLRLGYIVWKWLARTRNLRRNVLSKGNIVLLEIHVYMNRNTIKTHFSSKTEKSETKSHTLRPLRAALEEYAGPIPFLVVPKLYGLKKIKNKQKKDMKRWTVNKTYKHCLRKEKAYFFPACCCLCCSCIPSTAWWKLNTRILRLCQLISCSWISTVLPHQK